MRSWCRPDQANAAIAGTSDASRNVVDSVVSATQWRRLRCSGTYRVLGPAYNQTPHQKSQLQNSRVGLPAEDVCKDQWRDNRGIALNHELGCIFGKFFPGDFFIRHRAAVAAVAGDRVADLAKVIPEWSV